MLTDITNWRDADHNVWGFQDADKILRTDTIPEGCEASELKSREYDLNSFKVRCPSTVCLDLSTYLSQTECDGLVVLKDGVIAYEYYGRTNTKHSIHALFSVSKSMIGLLCGILVDQGKLDTENLISTYVPEILGSAYEDVKIRQLLDMRSGIKHDDAAPAYRNATGFYPEDPNEPPTDLHRYIPSIRSPSPRPIDGLDGPPYEYMSPNADLLGWVIGRSLDMKLAEVFSNFLWQPMQAESTGHFITDRSGNARAAAGVCSTTRDIARLGHVILQGGCGIVPESWIEDILHNGSQAAFAAGSESKRYDTVFNSVAYRSCWIVDQDSQTMMASGTNGQLLLIDHRNGVVMAKTSSQPEKTSWEKIHLNVRAFREFTRVIGNQDQ
ncbi:beta-lactamase/transpeptidase-like protein [Astrocystis sublimbata]|nr:beta-lactamase/transpeptidase-like protein [Astrocystis sublimbata]KAI0187274.1 beta-lactamase/transpeptidase-like protein [Astrocystis sublimbata]KAI0187277.1 beta-lactamase/transpeptidase-like protein [Astrocystis sublimbata]